MCISIQSFLKNHTASLLTFKPIKMFLLALALHLLIQAHVQILILILPLKTILFPLFLYSNGRTHTHTYTHNGFVFKVLLTTWCGNNPMPICTDISLFYSHGVLHCVFTPLASYEWFLDCFVYFIWYISSHTLTWSIFKSLCFSCISCTKYRAEFLLWVILKIFLL